MYTYMHLCICIYIYVYAYHLIHIYIYICICMCIYMDIYTNIKQYLYTYRHASTGFKRYTPEDPFFETFSFPH